MASIAFERGGLLGLATLALYVWIAPHHVVDGEDSHFATLAALGGRAHPSGYPLFVLWLRATSWLPGASAAHTAAIATALLAAAQIVVLHAACRAWGARPLAASLACALFAGAPATMLMYSEAEVFALNGLVVAAVLLLAASAGPVRGTWRCALLGLVAGLGLANHLTCALVAPVGVLGVARGVREAPRAKLAAAASAAAGLAIGLAPYLYLWIAPSNAASWGEVHGPGDILDIVLRRDYGGPGVFANTGEAVAATTSIGALAATLARTWLWLPGAAGLVALVARIVRPGEREPRWGWITLLASFAIAGPVLASRFDVPPVQLGVYVVRRFHLLPALLLAIPVADALDRGGAQLARWSHGRARAPLALGGVLGVLVFLAAAGPSLDDVARMHVPAVEQEAVNTLRSLPPDAIVFGGNDDLAAAIPYAQLVLGVRPDVVYVQWPMTTLPWYRARLATRGVGAGSVPRQALVAESLARGHQVFVEPGLRDLVSVFPHYPYGILMRVVSRDAKAPALDDVFAQQKAIYAKFELDYPRPRAGDEWPAAVHEKYAATWRALGRALEAQGKHEDAAWAFEAARDLGPQ